MFEALIKIFSRLFKKVESPFFYFKNPDSEVQELADRLIKKVKEKSVNVTDGVQSSLDRV